MTGASSSDDIGDDVVMTDEKCAGRPSSLESDSRRRITTKREPREVSGEQSSTTEQHVPRRVSGKTTPLEPAVAVTTQETLDAYREETMKIANDENNTLNWVSISLAGALDVMLCDFSVSPVSFWGLTKIRTGGAESGTRITRNSCASCTKRRWRAVATSSMS